MTNPRRTYLQPVAPPATDLAPSGLPNWAPPPLTEPPRRDVLAILRRNVRLIAACAVCAMAAAAFVTSRQARVYEAKATVRVDERQMGLTPLDAIDKLMSQTEVSTEQEVLGSRSIVEDVVDSLALQFEILSPVGARRDLLVADVRSAQDAGYARYLLQRTSAGQFAISDSLGSNVGEVKVGETVRLPGLQFRLLSAAAKEDAIEVEQLPFDDAVAKLQSTVAVERPNATANIISVTYRGTDPGLVRAVPNAIASRFIARRQLATQSASRSTVAFLRGQLDKLSKEMRVAEDNLRDYREREGLVNLPEQSRTQIERLASLQAQRSTLETERSALARAVDQAKSSPDPQGASRFREVLAFPTLLKDQATSQILGSLTVLEDRRAEMLTRRSANDPEVQALTERATELEERLSRIAQTYLQGLTDQVASIDGELSTSSRRLEAVPVQETRLAQLERDAKRYQDVDALLQTRLSEAEIAASAQDGRVRIIDLAILPKIPVQPKPLVALAVALVIGIALGASAALAREYADQSVRSRGEVQDLTGTPVLGLVPAIRRDASFSARISGAARALVPGSYRGGHRQLDRSTAFASDQDLAWNGAREAFNGLHARVSFADVRRTLVVTSALPGDGKTTVAVNLAGTISRQGYKVLLIDADIRRGIVHSVFRVPRSPGLIDVLAGASDLASALRAVRVANGRTLHVLTRGTPNDDPAQVLGPSRVRAFVDSIGSEFDWVIIDSPPMNVVADAGLLGATGAGVVLVARAGVTPTNALAYAAEQLRAMNATVVGTILNGIGKREASYDSAYRYYEYASGGGAYGSNAADGTG